MHPRNFPDAKSLLVLSFYRNYTKNLQHTQCATKLEQFPSEEEKKRFRPSKARASGATLSWNNQTPQLHLAMFK